MNRKPIVTTLLLAAAAAGCLDSVQAAVFSSRAYVQKGLVYQLDGIRNVGHYDEHDASVSVWKNLAGAGEVTLTGTALAWGADYFHFQNNAKSKIGDGKCEAFQDALNAHNATAEWTFYFGGGGTGPFWMGSDRYLAMWGTGGYGTFWIGHTGVSPAPVPVPQYTLHTLSLRASDIARIYTNGVLDVACTTTSYGTSRGSPYFRLGGSIQNTNTSNVKFYSLRFYDRALTEEEIALNANVDAVRFMGGAPAGKILTVTAAPVELGVSTPAYSTVFTNGGETEFSLVVGMQDYGDGVLAVPLGAGARYLYLGYAIAENGSNPVTNFTAATSFTRDVTADETIVSWSFSAPQYLLQVSGVAGVLVSIDGSTPAATASLWCDEGSEHVLEMTAAGTPESYFWNGVTKSEIADPTQATTTIVVREATTLTASVVSYPVYESEPSSALAVESRRWTLSDPWMVPGFQTVPGGLLLMVR